MSSSTPGTASPMAKLVPILLIAIGLALGAFGMSNLSTARESEAWPTADGTVTRSEVNRSRASSGDEKYTYKVIISYDFSVDSEDYTGSRVNFGMTSSSNASAARFVTESYRLDSKVAVYYDPADPNQCVLEPGVRWTAYLLPAIGILFLLLGIGLGLSRLLRR